ncbi:serine hydrolase domain-containing protein [Phytohalomonas tamaricis]|uniref:serine hydrolase domain-containing protein n=1 Tax=Phytohalomonas tamaricis TaxID=2081032 RepID=UPI000D0BD5E9|nr:serine hydrolase [Phytohalomonas tamaricis]
MTFLFIGAATSSHAETTTTSWDETSTQAAIERSASLSPPLHTLLVAYEGSPVIEHVFTGPGLDRPVNIKSLSKTVLSALVGIAIERGVFKSVDQPIVSLLGAKVPTHADPQIRQITVGHLLSMQAGLERTSGPYYGRWVASKNWVSYALTRPFVAEPGGQMLYSTGNSHLLSAALTRASGQSTLALARSWLGDPLNITIPPWTRDPQGIYFGGNEMALSPRALLAFGELYRTQGVVNGERLLPESWIDASWTPHTYSHFAHANYGYGWFMTNMKGHRVYYGWGYGGQMLYVIPELTMTVIMTSDPTPPSAGHAYLDQLDELVETLLIPAAEQAQQQ